MPRELLHWSVAEQALSQLDDAHSAVLRENWGALYVGAMLPDAFYYHRFGSSPFTFVSEYLHGAEGNDTFAAVRALMEVSARSSYSDYRPVVHALCFGLVTHIAADAVFHPMVYYMTGNYYHHDPVEMKNARTRHRLLETYMDSWATAHHSAALRTRSLTAAIQQRSGSMAVLSHALQYAISPRVIAEAQEIPFDAKVPGEQLWREALGALCQLQGMFRNPVLGAMLRGVNMLTLGSVRPIDALAAFGRGRVPEVLEAEMEYRNPVTGESAEKSVAVLWEEAVALTVKWWELLASHIADGITETTEIFPAISGPSLNFGEVGARVDEAIYFSEHGLPMNGLTIQR